MEDSRHCETNLMPGDAITTNVLTVSCTAFEALQNCSGPMNNEFSLQVLKISENATGASIERNSNAVKSTPIISQNSFQIYEPFSEIAFINDVSKFVDLANVKYCEDVVVTAVSESNKNAWLFQLLTPISQAQTFLSTDESLLTFPGYFTVGVEPGRLSPGIKTNLLSLNTEYSFPISTFRAGFGVNEQTILLKAVEQPSITFGRLLKSSFMTNHTYTLSVYANYERELKFFFLLTDEFGLEMCVVGCQGIKFVSFELRTGGNYSVRCDVYDSRGYTYLTSASGGNIVVISSDDEGVDHSAFATEAENAFLAGDHST
ncbi:unnamed protein product [Agarophyton chilense]